MMFVTLFLTFLKIGAISFGGGYGMVAVLYDEILSKGWMTAQELTDMVAVSESTPGPIAVNMATFVGSKQAGLLGGLVATTGVVLPAFIIILLISTLLTNLIKYKGVQAFLGGIRPCIVGMILATTLTMGSTNLTKVFEIEEAIRVTVDYKAVFVLLVLIAFHLLFLRVKNKKPSPIGMIVMAAFLGIIVNNF